MILSDDMMGLKEYSISLTKKNTFRKHVIFKIHPGIGIARVGSASEYFIGPEIPGHGATGKEDGAGTDVPGNISAPTSGTFKTGGKIKKQGARFRIYRYLWNQATQKYEEGEEVNIDTPGIESITWKISVANRKASFFNFSGPRGENSNFFKKYKYGTSIASKRNSSVANRDLLECEISKTVEFTQASKSNTAAIATELKVAKQTFPNTTAIPAGLRGQERKEKLLGRLEFDKLGRAIVLGGNGEADFVSATAPTSSDITSYVNNDQWFDDVMDGMVQAQIKLKSGRLISFEEIECAWVASAPPDFAPGIENVISTYETLTDIHVRFMEDKVFKFESVYDNDLKWLRDMRNDFSSPVGFTNYKVHFDREIKPFLEKTVKQKWVYPLPVTTTSGSPSKKEFHLPSPPMSLFDVSLVKEKTGNGASKRRLLFNFLRTPYIYDGSNYKTVVDHDSGSPIEGDSVMPLLHGDEYHRPSGISTSKRQFAFVTPVQYALMKQIVLKTDFDISSSSITARSNTVGVKAHELDKAALENCVGGAFFPGIEVSWLIRNDKLYRTPFRVDPFSRTADGFIVLEPGSGSDKQFKAKEIDYHKSTSGSTPNFEKLKVKPGFFSQQMALPWQADFFDCAYSRISGSTKRIGWWPAQRPDNVIPSPSMLSFSTPGIKDKIKWARSIGGKLGMSKDWETRGFVVKSGSQYIEKET